MAQNEDAKVEVVGDMVPGDEAPPGTPGTGEDTCPTCDGNGEVDGGACANCDGTGKVVRGLGGA